MLAILFENSFFGDIWNKPSQIDMISHIYLSYSEPMVSAWTYCQNMRVEH